MNRNTFNRLIAQTAWQEMFITEMGWNKPQGQQSLPTITVDNTDYNFTVVAQRNGFQILTCCVTQIPNISTARKIDLKLRRQANDYIAIYTMPHSEHHLWACPLKMNEKRDMVLVEYVTAQQADFLFSKLAAITFDVEEYTTIIDVRQHVAQAFAVNSEKITKDFYTGFRKEHKAFAQFITGIDDNIPLYDKKKQELNRNKLWYASVMLNRLMFCYFIQKKGFLNGDVDYLSHRLQKVQSEEGDNQFYRSFYRDFLVSLFHDGLNAPHHEPDWERRFGRIPYLNGGMFDVHTLEQQYADIDIADEAFSSLFAFFDTWQWHLDTRITATGKDINPDVLGYIFEQYINDRAAMGAYYTKEDITEYISKNCILPWLFDRVEETSRDAFKAGGFVWTALRESGDRYIYDAVKRGHTVDWQQRIPADIAVGIDTQKPDLLERRKQWNRPADEQFALPTEIWRETIERLQRCDTLEAKISNGEITHINDFVTLNLDIRSFTYDLLATTTDHLFVAHFYHALQRITILDPTCGSGAFLFAAMGILEPLYEVCILRMQEWNAENPNLFHKELGEIASKYRSNIQYFIYKSIILRNLYGVDIMVEATEIAKLRLFLKMVAVVEVDKRADNMGLDPLPDIDFNIRCGNTLVGYATEKELASDLVGGDMFAILELREKIEKKLNLVATAYELFRQIQLSGDDDREEYAAAKKDLRHELAELNELLSLRMYGTKRNIDYASFLASHQPFHWLAEFYQIIHGNGGFDVVIGNPPYVTFTDNSLPYEVKNFKTYRTKNLFALVGERCITISNKNSSIGYIIPLSGMSIDCFESFQREIYTRLSWNSFYSGDRNPSELFTGVKIRAGIYLSRPKCSDTATKYVCRYIKYYSSERDNLFSKVAYIDCFNTLNAPKLAGKLGKDVIEKVFGSKESLAIKFTQEDYIFYHAAPIYWNKGLYDLSVLQSNNLNIADSYKKCQISHQFKGVLYDIIHSSLFFYFWIAMSDCYNFTKKYFSSFRIPQIKDFEAFNKLAIMLNADLEKHMVPAEYTYKNKGKVNFAQFFPKLSKSIIDEIDKELAKHYGFTDEELDFIINYDIKYRMGDELNATD